MTNRKARRAAAKGLGASKGRPQPPQGAADRVGPLFERAMGRLERGERAVAADLFGQILSSDPNHVESLHQLGLLAHGAGQYEGAKAFFVRASRLAPDFAAGYFNLGLTQLALQDFAAARSSFLRAISLSPGLAEGHLALANVLHAEGKLQDAAGALQTALLLLPDYPAAHLNLGNILREQGLLTEAAASVRRALQLQPISALAHRALAVILQEQGLVSEAIDAFDRVLAIKPNFAEAQSGRLFCLNYDPARSAASITQAHRQWGERWARAPAKEQRVKESEQGRLRIGYVSADFHRHPVGYFFTGVVEAHDRTAVEVFCYANGGGEDDVTDRIRRAADHWRPIGALSDDAAKTLIRSDGIDILVDLSGHTASNRLSLFSSRAAPVQVSWLGYVATTGVPAMDYVITDAVTAPAGTDAMFTERLERMPNIRFCYTPPAYASPPAPPPSSDGRPFTFGSFNDLLKVGPEVIKAWSQILLATPDARLMLKWKSLGDEGVRRRLRDAFAAEGVAGERLELQGHTAHAAMLQEYGEVDVALDPFPFCGGLTTCEALWMGVPVVTLPMDRPASRQSLAFLHALDLTELAAESVESYHAIAVALARDPVRLADLRSGLRGRMLNSTLCRPDVFTPVLEAAYRAMWRRAGG